MLSNEPENGSLPMDVSRGISLYANWAQVPLDAHALERDSLRTVVHPLPLLFNPTLPINTTMALLVDKHRPRSLDQLSYHKDLSERLRSLVSSNLPT